MTVDYTIIALTVLFWIFPAIRQYKTELFCYFFILAVEDPLTMSLSLAKIFAPYNSYMIGAFILILALFWNYRKNRYTKVILAVFFLLICTAIGASMKIHYGILILFHLTILLFFLRRSIYFIAESGKANLFHLFLLLYETTIMLKMLVMLTEANAGLAFFHITTIFEILIAIFFSIFKENDSRLFINLKNV